MAFQPCPGVAMFEVFFQWQGQRMENVFHCVQEGAWDAAQLQDGVEVLSDWITSDWRNVAHLSANVVGFKGTDLTTQDGAVYEPTIAEPIPGLNNGTAAPAGTTIAISWRTALRGRSYRGRTFHVGVQTASYTDSIFLPTPLALLYDAYLSLQGAFISASMEMCVLSRVLNKAVRANGVGTPITGLSIDPALDSQRRRLPERGR